MPRAESGENELSAMPGLRRAQLFDVAGKRVVVTGGGSGIGAMIAMGFVANGAHVYIVSRKDTSAFAAELQQEAGAGKCTALQADLGTDKGVAHFAAELARREPEGIDVLVNNSGTNWAKPIEEYEPEAWDKVYALNVKAVFNLTRLLLPLLEKKAGAGEPSRVINISSIDGLRVTNLDTFAYSSGKAAVTHLTRVLAGKLGERNITVNAVLPGPFPSRMMRGTIKSAGESIKRGVALNRLGEPRDMAGACIFLASSAGSFVTGASIVVDGGSVVKPRM